MARAQTGEAPFIAACWRRQAPYTPVWFMRQAGRSLPEYRALRGSGSIIETVRHPDLVAELTAQPVRRYGVDAAVLFSDIVVPIVEFGLEVAPGTGPVIEKPFREVADLDRLRPADTGCVDEAVRLATRELQVPLIGFAGGPFTLASYLVEGGPSQDHALTKALMWGEPELWESLMQRLVDICLDSLQCQVRAGAAAVQIFESWGGALSPGEYGRHVLPALGRLLAGLAGFGVPRIVFGVCAGELLRLFAGAGADVVGVDWRVPLDVARMKVGAAVALQGNLDPAACLAPWEALARQAREVLALGGETGHVFNLGHGVLPATDPDQLARLVDLVHAESAHPQPR
ncbi:MAG TPA: uroporphyrinogen decarboxylase [Acidimicrobiales bacterium]|nr:uroporphyrinogen decarboxylase [Acidimicrobiales bacterium]